MRGGGRGRRKRKRNSPGWMGGGGFCSPGEAFYLQKISPPCSYNITAGAAIINILKPPKRGAHNYRVPLGPTKHSWRFIQKKVRDYTLKIKCMLKANVTRLQGMLVWKKSPRKFKLFLTVHMLHF